MNSSELKRFALLAGLDDEQREDVAAELEVRILDPGDVVFEEGDPGDGLVLVAIGEVAVASDRQAGAARFGPGTAIGALSLVTDGRRESSANAEMRSRLLVLDRDAYRRLVDGAPRTACALLEAILVDCADALRAGLVAPHKGAASDGIDPVRGTH